MDVNEAVGPQEGNFFKRCIRFLKNLNDAYLTNTNMLIFFNYGLLLSIANQSIFCDHPFQDMDTANSFGLEVIPPGIDSTFGFVFLFMTGVVNGLAVGAVLVPNRNFRKLLAPAMLWTVYTIFAIVESTLTRVLVLYKLEVPFLMYSSVLAAGLLAAVVQTKLAFNVYYDHYHYL